MERESGPERPRLDWVIDKGTDRSGFASEKLRKGVLHEQRESCEDEGYSNILSN